MADTELTRTVIPGRVYTASHIEYAVARIRSLYKHPDLVRGLMFVYEPPVLRFFDGRLKTLHGWRRDLSKGFKKEIGDY